MVLCTAMNPTSLRRLSRTARERGFSLIELGIVLAVIAVLGTVVVASVGYLGAARQQACVELVQAIRKAAQNYAMRHHNGIAFGRNRTDNLLSNLRVENFLPNETKTPWEPEASPTRIEVFADDGTECRNAGGSADACAKCAGLACVLIRIPIDADDNNATCNDLVTIFSPTSGGFAIAARCNGTNLEVVTR